MSGLTGFGRAGLDDPRLRRYLDTFARTVFWQAKGLQVDSSGNLEVTLGEYDTDDLPEGNTNLYYTDERVDDRVAALVQDGTGLTWTYNDGAGTFTGVVSLSPFDTDDLSEGSNLYYTDERVDDRVAALIQDGTGISWTYDDGAGTLTGDVSVSGGDLTIGDTVSVSDTEVVNTTTETSVYSESVAADEFHANQIVRVVLRGTYSSAADTFTLRLKVGGTTVLSVISPNDNGTDFPLESEFLFTVRSDGASGTITGSLGAVFNQTHKNQPGLGTVSVDTTTTNTIEATIQWDTASTSDTVTITQAFAEFMN